MVTSVWMVFLLMAEAVSSEIIRVSAGGDVLLPSGLETHVQGDVRWTHDHLLLRKNRTSMGPQGRCELLKDGSLRFSRVQTGDSGNYTLELFDYGGKLLQRKDFLLQVEDVSSSVGSLTFIFCLLLTFLLLLLIVIFILRRRSQRTIITGPKEENYYMAMHERHGNKEENIYAAMHGCRSNKEEETAKQEKEAESLYVPCHPSGSMETPTTVEEEDIYV